MLCFFNLAGAIYDRDIDGHEMAMIGHARIAAVRYLADCLRERSEVLWSGEEVHVEVTNDARLVLSTVIAFGIDAPSIGERKD